LVDANHTVITTVTGMPLISLLYGDVSVFEIIVKIIVFIEKKKE
jgi:hypothetical protein